MDWCPKRKYHEYVVKQTLPNAQLELCAFCGHKAVFRTTDQGRLVRPKEYREAHIRAFAQPTGSTAKVFHEIYGYEPEQDAAHMAKQHAKHKKNQDDLIHEYKSYMKGGDKTVLQVP